MADPQPLPENPRHLDPETLTALQPGLARLMPEVGARMWKAYYAAGAANWPLATWQLKELEKLLRLCMVTRPKYRGDLEAYIHEDLAPLRAALDERDLVRFRPLYHDAVAAANEYHRRWQKPWILWRLPDAPPPDLDLTPQPESGPPPPRSLPPPPESSPPPPETGRQP